MPKTTHTERTKRGHNSLAVDVLKETIARVEKLQEEKEGLTADIRDIFAEAKGQGLDVKVIKDVLKVRKADASALAEHMALVRCYCEALDIANPFA